MATSVVIPSSKKDLPMALALKEKLKGRGAGEILVEASGTWTENRNKGFEKAKGTSICFIDADIEDVEKIDFSTLESYGFDIAQPYFKLAPIDIGWEILQNVSAVSGLPFTTFGAFLFVRRSVLREIGPFRVTMPSDDVEWARRAWLSGYQLDRFPFTVRHMRPLNYMHGIGSPITAEGIWGIP